MTIKGKAAQESLERTQRAMKEQRRVWRQHNLWNARQRALGREEVTPQKGFPGPSEHSIKTGCPF